MAVCHIPTCKTGLHPEIKTPKNIQNLNPITVGRTDKEITRTK